MLRLNENLLNQLPALFGERVLDFTDKIWGENKAHRWGQLRTSNWGRLQCNDLIKIANMYHIPLCHFLLPEDDPTVYTDRKQFVYDCDWIDVEFHPENMCNEYRSANPKYLLKDFAAGIETTPSCIYRWFAPGAKCSMSVKEALKMTYNMELPLSFLFIDKNVPLPSHIDTKSTDGYERAVEEMRMMREKIHSQQRTIKNLQSDVENLKHDGVGYMREDEVDYGEYTTRVRPFLFNQKLWDNLHVVVGTSKRELSNITGVSTTLPSPSVAQLIKVCNALEISTHHFLLRSITVPDIYTADHYRCDFTQVSFEPTRLDSIFCVGNILNRHRKETLEVLGVNDMMSRRWTKPDSRLSVLQLVDICNELDITPAVCITDNNHRPYGSTLTEMLIEENMILRQKLYTIEKNK